MEINEDSSSRQKRKDVSVGGHDDEFEPKTKIEKTCGGSSSIAEKSKFAVENAPTNYVHSATVWNRRLDRAVLKDDTSRSVWVDRNYAQDKILEETESLVDELLWSSSEPRDFGGFIVSGGKGVGKTRLGLNISRLIGPLLRQSKNWSSTQMFFDVSTYSENHRHTNSSAELWLKKFIVGHYDVPVENIIPSHSNIDALDCTETVEWSHVLQNVRKSSDNDNAGSDGLVIFLHFDNYEENVSFCKSICLAIGFCLSGGMFRHKSDFSKQHILLVPIFTGSHHSKLRGTADDFGITQLLLAGLDSEADAHKLFMDKYSSELSVTLESEASNPISLGALLGSNLSSPSLVDHRTILSRIGYIPALVECYATLMAKTMAVAAVNATTSTTTSNYLHQNFDEIFNSLVSEVKIMYPSLTTINGDDAVQIAILSYFAINVNPHFYKINSIHLDELSQLGILHLVNPHTHPRWNVNVKIPYIYYHIWLPEIFKCRFSSTIPIRNLFTSTHDYETHLQTLFIDMHNVTLSMLNQWVNLQLRMKASGSVGLNSYFCLSSLMEDTFDKFPQLSFSTITPTKEQLGTVEKQTSPPAPMCICVCPKIIYGKGSVAYNQNHTDHSFDIDISQPFHPPITLVSDRRLSFPDSFNLSEVIDSHSSDVETSIKLYGGDVSTRRRSSRTILIAPLMHRYEKNIVVPKEYPYLYILSDISQFTRGLIPCTN